MQMYASGVLQYRMPGQANPTGQGQSSISKQHRADVAFGWGVGAYDGLIFF
ncbi:hypothetical protein [Paenibacillus sp. RC62]|uniref:hypothetical protein n=1 Tax=Paenibacillus sp. RC62 TaxID=3156248 RepID=UPI0038332192